MKKTRTWQANLVPIALIGLSLILQSLPFLPYSGTPESSLWVALGHLHPLLVHFPIVLIILPLLLEGLIRIKKWDLDVRLMPLLLTLAILSATASALAGFGLYYEGTYIGERIHDHLWAGIMLALTINFCGFAFHLKWSKLFMGGLVLANLLLIYTGHLGGTLTHGEDYLSDLLPAWDEPTAPVEQKPLAELNVFDDIVMAVFEAKCLTCHNSQKAKGKLVMSSWEDLMRGGESGDSMIVKKSWQSGSIHQRISLPMDDEAHMPPKGKTQLSADEQMLLTWWLKSGGQAEQLVGTLPQGDSIQLALDSYLPKLARRQKSVLRSRQERDELAAELIPHVEALGFAVELDPAADSMLFALSMQLPAVRITDATLVELLPYADAFSKISLVSAEITDEGLYTLSQMSQVRHLYLNKSCIKGEGLAYLTRLEQLETLNLSDTFVDDKEVLHLLEMPSLKQVYLYHAEVSLNVIEALQAFLPETEVLHAEGEMY
ncbi:MAG: c-type cytochrome domain-containing protein [Bacteroidia bacterium]